MSYGGPKMEERSYGVAGNGLKWPKKWENSGESRWPPPPPPLCWPDPAASGGGWP